MWKCFLYELVSHLGMHTVPALAFWKELQLQEEGSKEHPTCSVSPSSQHASRKTEAFFHVPVITGTVYTRV